MPAGHVLSVKKNMRIIGLCSRGGDLRGPPDQMRASVIITTKDRKHDLRRAITSVVRQTVPVDILVVDDGSTDGTSEMVSTEFPQVRLDRTPVSLGCVVQRNRAALLCSCEIVFSIDDDAEFSSPRIVEQTLEGFSHPRVAAIAMPYVEPNKSEQELQKAPDADAVWVTDSFRGTSYALRRKVFLQAGGYREHIFHQGEEMDLCIRLLNFGFVVRLGSGDAVNHYESPKRDRRRIDFYSRRNDILFAWRNVPMPYLPTHLLGTTFNGIISTLFTERSSAIISGMLSGYRNCASNWDWHEPVSQAVYRMHRMLKKRGPKVLSELEPFLPPMGFRPNDWR
jgi:glycosyltransferase involved in cell wall biosynthesis